MRFLHRIHARLFNYFWLPCPICGKMFGGHESEFDNTLYHEKRSGKCVCKKCGPEARRRNKENGWGFWYDDD